MSFFKRSSSKERSESRWFVNSDNAAFKPVPSDEMAEFKAEASRESDDLEMLWPTAASSQPLMGPNFKVDPRIISDAIIGLSDGLTVPFALTAGLSTLGTRTVIFAGLAELIAGAISMGLGGYLGAKSEGESYEATVEQTQARIAKNPENVAETVSDIFTAYDIPAPLVDSLAVHLADSPKLVDFLMAFEHTQPEPPSSRAVTCAITIASCYFAGGFLPLLPYMFVGEDEVMKGLFWSIGVMIVALFLFGYSKTCFVSGWRGRRNVLKGLWGAGQMVLVGSAAAGAAMGLVRLFDKLSS
ncbi:Protein ccc1 [Pseudogymnoascus australis]